MNKALKPYTHFADLSNILKTLLVVSIFVVTACTDSKQQEVKTAPTKRDTSISIKNAYSDIFFDSVAFEKILQQNKWTDTVQASLRNFYNSRNYQYAWFTDTGFTEQTRIFWNVQSDYIQYSNDSSLYNDFLEKFMDSADAKNDRLVLDKDTKLKTEIQLTGQFIQYARRAYQGNISLDDKDLSWFIPRKRINTIALLDSLVKNKGKHLENYEPVNPQYRALKKHLLRYYQLQKSGGWPVIITKQKVFKKGDTSAAIAAIKRRLATTEDYKLKDTSYVFTDSLQEAVKRFQYRYGLKQDGIIGGNTLRYLKEPIDVRIKQILVNMERMRWVPAIAEGDFVLINIPQFRLTAFEDGKAKFGMNIIVGKSQNRTVIFTGNLKYVVFAPYWNVPPGILKKEVLPAIQKDPYYLEKNDMEWNGNTVRQRPGVLNALGQVKFLFPNSYNIYLHDTPAKSLFEQDKRTFSHGCIRIAEPRKMAIWLLRHQPEWTEEKIDEYMNGDTEHFVTIKKQIPVYITYFTAWANSKGQMNFRDDVYGHDQKLAERLFSR